MTRTVNVVSPEAVKFDLGAVVMTTNFQDRMKRLGENLNDVVRVCLGRHSTGDWGDICPEDRQANDAALKNEQRLMSVYRTRCGTKYWVITEWDRSVTTILLPEDY